MKQQILFVTKKAVPTKSNLRNKVIIGFYYWENHHYVWKEFSVNSLKDVLTVKFPPEYNIDYIAKFPNGNKPAMWAIWMPE
uniref:Uncharacterized protein n=1 Tax=viral metagenome TaxID=1070528 RepID=A0A6M3LQ37_9ZZZZ